MTTPTSFGNENDLERLKSIIGRWRTSLVDLSGRNRLLNFRHTQAATLEIKQPSLDELFLGLERGWDFAPLPEEEPQAGARLRAVAEHEGEGIVTQKTTAPTLDRALQNLRRRSTQVFNDYGIWTLQLGFGMLNWREDGAETGSDAPLILVPVLLERTSTGRTRLVLNEDEEPKLNPALPVKLEQFYIDWSPVAELDPTDIDAVLTAVEACVDGKSGWTVSDRVVLGLFASHKESMYQDLLDNEAEVVRSDLIQAVALGPSANLAPDRFDFEEIELDRIDELSPPEDSPLVLDADASQRQAVAAAVAGHSFVMDGPPGTGKSQTITNMIAALIHAGRSVLFVSEKAAALDVVLDRLHSVGLDSYVLALHSKSTSRAAVAKELGRALEEEPRAPRLEHGTKEEIERARELLTGYADAMNEVRRPLQRTLHDAIGRIANLADAPVAYVDSPEEGGRFNSQALTGRDLAKIVDAAETVARGWVAVADPQFPWRKLRPEATNIRPSLEQAQAALHVLTAAVERYREISESTLSLANEHDVERFLQLLRLVKSRLDIPQWWLTTLDFVDDVEEVVDRFLEELGTVHEAVSGAHSTGGERWRELPLRLESEAGNSERALGELTPTGLVLATLDENSLRNTLIEFRRLSESLERTHLHISALADDLGMFPPRDGHEAEIVCKIAELSLVDHRPLEGWFVPEGVLRARKIATALTGEKLTSFFTRRDNTQQAIESASAEAGRRWQQLDRSLVAGRSSGELALTSLDPSGMDLERWNSRQLRRIREVFDESVEGLANADELATSLAHNLGCNEPENIEDVRTLIELVHRSDGRDRALKEWFDPDVLVQVHEAVGRIESAVDHLQAVKEEAGRFFLPSVVEVPDLSDAITRLTEGPRGFGALFSRQVRSDRKAIAGHTVNGSWKADLYDALHLAQEWQAAHRELSRMCTSYKNLLGRFVDADALEIRTEQLRAALTHAETIHELVPNLLVNPRTRNILGERLGDGDALDSALVSTSRRLDKHLQAWTHVLEIRELSEIAPSLAHLSLGRTTYWVQAHLEPLALACDFMDEVLRIVGRFRGDGSEHTLGSARAAVMSAHHAQDELATFLSTESEDRKLLGMLYTGLDTAFEVVVDAVASDSRSASRLLRDAIEDLTNDEVGHLTSAQIELLGRYAQDGNPDVEPLSIALGAAESVAHYASDVLDDLGRRSKMAWALADGRSVPEGWLERVEDARKMVANWEGDVRQAVVGPSGPALFEVTASSAASWMHAHLDPLTQALDLVSTVSRVVDDRRLNVESARAAVSNAAAARRLEQEFSDNERAHRELLGGLYNAFGTAPAEIRDAMAWAHAVRRAVNEGVSKPLQIPTAKMLLTIEQDDLLPRYLEDWKRQKNQFLECFKPKRRNEIKSEIVESLAAATDVLDRLASDPYGPETWVTCTQALNVLDMYRLRDLPYQLAQRGVSGEEFPAAVERAVLVSWVEHHFSSDSRLKPHRGADRDELVARFQELDRELVEAAHGEVIAACNARRPRKTTIGQASVLRRESMKQRRHMPVRRLLDETRDVVQLIKPCFMMSPLTVSQFLSSDFRFDVVIFDEASQVLPQDAVNSIYRGDALVVAGDPRQLPPTSFFNAASDSDDEDEMEDDDLGFESILDTSKASGILRSLPLRWHYRSRHEHLIAFSNHEFYENSMVTFPGSREDGHDIGVEFFKVDGIYDRGGRRDNQVEAAYVAQRVIHHFETRPHLTLGVVALSKVQAEAIEEAVDKALKTRPGLSRYFTDNRLDGFFIKNLETVQGDERDVIILSIGYGPDAQGRLRSEFGPINRDGGWRRLNVAVTRARRRMEVVASFHGSQLPDSANKSVQHLKRYLEYAEHGPNVLATQVADPEAVPESPFEESVITVLREMGYSVQPQVGVAGYRIDMAVRHPDAPGTYALGIECDGVMYHSSRAARDRDRLRESVLRDLGWKLHRIWGTDWYRSRGEAIARLKAAVEDACAVNPHLVQVERHRNVVEVSPTVSDTPDRAHETTPAPRAVEFVSVEEGTPEWAEEYRFLSDAELQVIRQKAVDDLGYHWIDLQDERSTRAVSQVVLAVVDREGPIEEELIFSRVRSAWMLARSGQVVQKTIRAVLKDLVKKKKIVSYGTAYDLAGRESRVARTPTAQCARKAGHVPAIERQLVLQKLAQDCPGLSRAELLRETARFFGWARLGSDIKGLLNGDIENLIGSGALVANGQGLSARSTSARTD
ncbi:DUF3320 domain-containing protein [Rhodococcus sp. AB351]|uniref:DUF3320 domain-containing protein n=1 Tax=Rhodococcus sp. AB351 TaxID=3413280 RepID=UPI003C17556F